MKIKVLLILILFLSFKAGSWGLTGHRVTGEIAQKHLSRKAQKEIKRILGDETLAEAANFMDFIKSEPKYDFMGTWHYVTIPAGETYETAKKEPLGDVIWAINKFTGELMSDTLTSEEEVFALRCLIHLVGDIHQPLHVGNGTDRGGNDVRIKYFWQNSNLHRIWDSGMIDGQLLSYSEWTNKLDHADKATIEKWQSASVEEWAYESQAMLSSVYDFGDQDNLTYRYNYDHLHEVELRLHQAGIRLAGLLNRIYR